MLFFASSVTSDKYHAYFLDFPIKFVWFFVFMVVFLKLLLGEWSKTKVLERSLV